MLHALRSRRSFLATAAAGAAAMAWPIHGTLSSEGNLALEAGEGTVDITPPLGIEMAGFHRSAGNERRITGIRQATAARALVLRMRDTLAALVSLDISCASLEMTTRIQQQIAQQCGIPASNVRICATHTHSTPTLRYLRQWGAISPEYVASVEKSVVRAVEIAMADLAPTAVHLGKCRAPGASNNRTTKTWKTDEQFVAESTDDDRWLDTMVHVLHFERAAGKPSLLWYHFSAHPVCYNDDLAGPDWPGLVTELVRSKHQLTPSYLQGHSGDVNAGDADHWIGTAENTANRVADAISQALHGARQVPTDQLRLATQPVPLPLDMELFGKWLNDYRSDPAKCASDLWVDAGFAEDWFRGSAQRDMNQNQILVPVSVMQLGDVAMAFHPAELYSCYGLTIRRDSPVPDTLVVGYTDDIVGYVPDPNAYKSSEYAALVVPKILDYPPFVPTVGRTLSTAIVAMLQKLVA